MLQSVVVPVSVVQYSSINNATLFEYAAGQV